MVHFDTKNAKSRVHQSEMCNLLTTHFSAQNTFFFMAKKGCEIFGIQKGGGAAVKFSQIVFRHILQVLVKSPIFHIIVCSKKFHLFLFYCSFINTYLNPEQKEDVFEHQTFRAGLGIFACVVVLAMIFSEMFVTLSCKKYGEWKR